MNDARDRGSKGEDIAQEFLFRNGFNLLHRNWRNGRYEIDIVAEKDGVLHIVEVKTRKPGAMVPPENAMTREKFRALSKAVQYYVELYKLDMDVQFDLIAIDHDGCGETELRYIPDVMFSIW